MKTYRATHLNETTPGSTSHEAVAVYRRDILGIIGLMLASAAVSLPQRAFAVSLASLSNTEASAGLKEALTKGSEAAVSLLGKPGGFLDNAKVRIPLPDGLRQAQSMLKLMGKGKEAQDLEVAMNRAAEAAVPEAKALLIGAVQSMSVQDAKGILTGGDNSATQYFKGKTQTPLTQRFLPIVSKAIDNLGLVQMYNQYAGQAAQFGVVRKEDANVQQYVTRKALDGLYLMIGEQEKAIRQDPVGAGSALLGKVFGAIK